jgi:hypothetical protein
MKEEAAVRFTGSQVADVNDGITLSAQVVQEQDGSSGRLEGLPILFVLSEIHPDGSVVPLGDSVTRSVYATVTQTVYATDANGVVSVPLNLPAGYYEVRTTLCGNPYYKGAETVSRIAVFDPSSGPLEMDGFFGLDGSDAFMGTGAQKVHMNMRWGFKDQSAAPPNLLHIHAEPLGMELMLQTADWLVLAGDNAYLQGRAESGGVTYTVRLMAQAGASTDQSVPIVSLQIWRGTDITAAPVFKTLGAHLNGRISVSIK